MNIIKLRKIICIFKMCKFCTFFLITKYISLLLNKKKNDVVELNNDQKLFIDFCHYDSWKKHYY